MADERDREEAASLRNFRRSTFSNEHELLLLANVRVYKLSREISWSRERTRSDAVLTLARVFFFSSLEEYRDEEQATLRVQCPGGIFFFFCELKNIELFLVIRGSIVVLIIDEFLEGTELYNALNF